MTKPVPARASIVAALLFACSVAPSRTPLGGNYTLPELAPAGDRHAPSEASARPAGTATQPTTAIAAPSATLAAVPASAVTQVAAADAIRFEPLRAGSRIKAEVTLNASVEMRGAPPSMGDGKFSLDSRLRFELEVRKASTQSLDELELTLTTLSMRSEFAGQSSDEKLEPKETYDIALAGSSPIIRARSGSEVDTMARVKIAILLVPLAEFYARWARSPTLELKPGWSSAVSMPFASALFATTQGENLRAGPVSVRFASRSPASAEVPFELALPLQYRNDLGKIQLDLTGSAKLNANSGRPTAFDLSGPLSATGGPQGTQLSLSGRAKLTCSLSYP
jgi:hypothetical protein